MGHHQKKKAPTVCSLGARHRVQCFPHIVSLNLGSVPIPVYGRSDLSLETDGMGSKTARQQGHRGSSPGLWVPEPKLTATIKFNHVV